MYDIIGVSTERYAAVVFVRLFIWTKMQQLPVEDVLLLFGSDDEWCTPAVAKRVHVTLNLRTVSSNGYAPCERYVTKVPCDTLYECFDHVVLKEEAVPN